MPEHTIDEFFQEIAKVVLRTEMARRKMTYADLVQALREKWGIEDNERNLRNKVARGTFSAAFFLQCLTAIGCEKLVLTDFVDAEGETDFGLGIEMDAEADALRTKLITESE